MNYSKTKMWKSEEGDEIMKPMRISTHDTN
jgi:hypothetical protein